MFGFSQPPALALIQPLPAMLLVMALSHTLAATPLLLLLRPPARQAAAAGAATAME